MNTIQRVISAVATAGLMMTASLACATTFSVSAASFAPENGYSTDKNDLDVLFTNTNFSAQTFSLNTVGDFKDFDFGFVNFRETGEINQPQLGSLNVLAYLTFTSPLAEKITVSATGTATTGPVTDSAVDYKIDWAPTFVNFGSGGQFQVELNDLSFTTFGQKTQGATVTLLKLSTPPAPPAGETPEPGTVALFGLGLLGVAAARRKAAKGKNV